MEVLIVGSGVVGLSVAFELALAGHRVKIVTRNYEEGASWVAGGMLAPFSEGLLGDELKLSLESLSLYPEFLEKLADVSKIHPFFDGGGILRVFLSEEERNEFSDRLKTYKAMEAPFTEVDPKEWGLSESVHSAVLFEREGNVDSEKLMDALLFACENLRMEIAMDDVTRVTIEEGKVKEVRGFKGTYGADFYVFCPGAWTGAIFDVPIYPIKGQILKLKGVEPEKVIYSSVAYIIPKEGYFLIGATSEDAGFDTRPTAEGINKLLSGALKVFPPVGDAEFLGVKVGFRPATPDGKPVFEAGENYALLTGHYRNGILWAPVGAKMVLDLIEKGERSEFFEVFGRGRFGE